MQRLLIAISHIEDVAAMVFLKDHIGDEK